RDAGAVVLDTRELGADRLRMRGGLLQLGTQPSVLGGERDACGLGVTGRLVGVTEVFLDRRRTALVRRLQLFARALLVRRAGLPLGEPCPQTVDLGRLVHHALVVDGLVLPALELGREAGVLGGEDGAGGLGPSRRLQRLPELLLVRRGTALERDLELLANPLL